jgi:hypothetical protein
MILVDKSIIRNHAYVRVNGKMVLNFSLLSKNILVYHFESLMTIFFTQSKPPVKEVRWDIPQRRQARILPHLNPQEKIIDEAFSHLRILRGAKALQHFLQEIKYAPISPNIRAQVTTWCEEFSEIKDGEGRAWALAIFVVTIIQPSLRNVAISKKEAMILAQWREKAKEVMQLLYPIQKPEHLLLICAQGLIKQRRFNEQCQRLDTLADTHFMALCEDAEAINHQINKGYAFIKKRLLDIQKELLEIDKEIDRRQHRLTHHFEVVGTHLIQISRTRGRALGHHVD